jgi:hypothetical protein
VIGQNDTRTQSETLVLLRKRCSMTLDVYIALAKRGCELLTQVEEVPLSEARRNEILSHRRQELHSQSDYTKARSKLWAFLNKV